MPQGGEGVLEADFIDFFSSPPASFAALALCLCYSQQVKACGVVSAPSVYFLPWPSATQLLLAVKDVGDARRQSNCWQRLGPCSSSSSSSRRRSSTTTISLSILLPSAEGWGVDWSFLTWPTLTREGDVKCAFSLFISVSVFSTSRRYVGCCVSWQFRGDWVFNQGCSGECKAPFGFGSP